MQNQKGAIQFIVLLILLAGIAGGVYLIKTGNLKLFSKATNPPIVFKTLEGQSLPLSSTGVPQTTSPNVKVELTSTLGPPASVSGPISGPTSNQTVSYRTGFDPTQLDSAVFISYIIEPTVYNIGFQNTLGTQFYWVEFKSTNGTTDRRSAQIEIISASPSPTPSPTATSTATPTPISAVTDNFNRSNNSNTLGTSWTALRGRFGISSNQAYVSSGCPAPGYAVIEGGSSDGTLQVTLANNTQDARIPFRVQDLNNNYFLERDGWGYHLEKTVSGRRFELTPRRRNANLRNGDIVKIYLKGNSIKVYINNSQLLLYVNDSSISGTKYGIGTWCDTKMRFDDFSFTP